MGHINPGIEVLTEATCWRLLDGEQIGRLALTASDGIDIFPIDFVVASKVLYFRSAPGQKLVDIMTDPIVAFEVDGTASDLFWSVVVRGMAQRVNSDREIEDSGVLHLKTHSPTSKWNYVRITPTAVTGRRFAAPL